MRIEQDSEFSDLVLVHADASLNNEDALTLVDDVEERIDRGTRHVIVDCADLREINSYGLGMLIRLHHRLRKRGGDVKLTGVRGTVAAAIEMTRLDRVFPVFESVAAARASCHAAA
ncbi:MAG: STAS domain-containing protein [Phycisphaeraceae bacterium]|nr:STAS domain-containing protein [Phycisphaerales bacterium]QOJ18337.1 MAG: STAS domain-containing protein [Phycisphaeraceae bacterium]